MRRAALGCALAAALVVGGCGGGGAPKPPVVPGRVLHVYTSLPFQGDLATRARDTYDAERLALAEAGARSGRYRVRLVPLDSSTTDAGRWDPNQVIANARRATQDPRTIAYIGELDTGASAVSIPVLDQKGILQVSPADGLAGLTRREGATRGEPEKYYPDPRRNFARIAPPDNRQAAALAAYMKELGVTRLYVANDGGGYGVAIADAVVVDAAAVGIGVVANDTITPQGADYAGAARRVLRTAPDAMFFGGTAHDRPQALWEDLHTIAPRLKLFGPNALALPDFYGRLGPSAASTYLVDPSIPPRDRSQTYRSFVDRFRSAYHRSPDPYAVYGYEAMRVVLGALRRAGRHANDRRRVIRRVFGLRRADSAVGPYTIGPQGDSTLRSFGAYRVRRGRLVFDRLLTPPGA
ncbi:MAG: branched-chain amino acid transport system substrate-binding protein [Solirubrobacteraceae bacterium]|nr:branched-chain amino acid transport system substrate-binding protein [Solirubrobacteraceae bacterium]